MWNDMQQSAAGQIRILGRCGKASSINTPSLNTFEERSSEKLPAYPHVSTIVLSCLLIDSWISTFDCVAVDAINTFAFRCSKVKVNCSTCNFCFWPSDECSVKHLVQYFCLAIKFWSPPEGKNRLYSVHQLGSSLFLLGTRLMRAVRENR